MPVAQIYAHLSDPAQPDAIRKTLFKRLRKPGTRGATPTDDMPRLLGDDPYDQYGTGLIGLSLTVTQYALMEQWANGNFLASGLGPGSLNTPPVAAGITPGGLDRAALELASGGAFFPGIEVGWQIREKGVFAEPLRIKPRAGSRYVGDPPGSVVGPGYFSRQMALPWLADFLQCKTESQSRAVPASNWGWWPSQRPDFVYASAADAAARAAMKNWTRAQSGAGNAWPAAADGPSPRPAEMPSYSQMIATWWKFGFIAGTPSTGYAETERAGGIP